MLSGVTLCAVEVLGQTPAAPSRTQCKQWDDTYLSVFHGLAAWALVGTILLCILLPFLGRKVWLLTAPQRIVWITAVNLALTALLAVAYPRLLGFGGFIYTGVDARYADCATGRFGAQGLLYGAYGEGTAAVALWLAMLAVFLFAALLGGIISYVIARGAAATFGVESRVGGETG